MRGKPRILFVMLGLLAVAASQAVAADLATGTLEYLEQVHDRADKKLNDYLIAELEGWLDVWPEHAAAPKVHTLLGTVLEEDGKQHLALAIYARGVFLHPVSDQREACLLGARRMLAKGSTYKESREELIGLLDADARNKTADRFYANLEFLSKLPAAKLHEQCLSETYTFHRRFPGDRRLDITQLWLALSWSNRNKHEIASAELEQLIALYPRSQQLPCILYSHADILANELREIDAARPILDRVIGEFSSSPYAPKAMGLRADISLKRDRNYTAAIEDYRKLVENWPGAENAPEARLAIPEIYETKLKDYEQAASEYGKLAALDPNGPKGLEYLMKAGRLHESKTRNYGLALSYYEEALARYPNNNQIESLRKKISKMRDKAAGPSGRK